MGNHGRKSEGTLTMVEAIETLSNIAELGLDQPIKENEQGESIDQEKAAAHTINWIRPKDASVNVEVIRATFRVILDYLKNFYKNEYPGIYDPQTLERITTIMVLVGEAAKKLDKYTTLFKEKQGKSVTELKEYKNLQEFYLSRIARKIDEGVLGKWILGLAQKVSAERPLKSGIKLQGKAAQQVKHIFIDLDSVKKDTEYELFLLRKEDGSRFFNPRLIRNIKLVSDFGDYFDEERPDDPLVNMEIWQDKVAYACARSIIHAAYKPIDNFYRQLQAYKESELAYELNKGLMALMLAANPHNLSHNLPIKNCSDYLYDFQYFLRHCLHSREYERLASGVSKTTNAQDHIFLNVIRGLCKAIYLQAEGIQEITSWVHGLIQQAIQEEHQVGVSIDKEKISKGLWAQLERDYSAMGKVIKLHPHGPLNKILSALEDGEYREFDPFIQANMPSQMFSLHAKDHVYSVARWPSPTHQEYIHKATVIDEFKAFLHACEKEQKGINCLLFNLQDKVTWKDHSRCQAIEELNNYPELRGCISIATIAKDTEFYHQLAPYHLEDNAQIFIKHFSQQLMDEHCGFFFPKEYKKDLHENFIQPAMKAIHHLFFSDSEILTREQRMDFIEIFYLFLQLKLMDILQPAHVGFTCKDSIDIGASSGAQLFVFLKLLSQERMTENDLEYLDLMLYGPALLYRERLMLPERFNRVVSAIKAIELVRQECGQEKFSALVRKAFGPLYKTPILEGKVAPKVRQKT